MVERRLCEADVGGSNPSVPIHIHITTMQFYTVEHWQKNWEKLIERVESGEHIGIENENGNRAVMIPADDELIKIYTELNNEAP